MPNRRRNLYWSIETDKKAVDLAWKNHQSVSAFLADLILREAGKQKGKSPSNARP